MSLSSRSNQYGKVLGDWNIRKEIGEGSKGTIVYKIVRKGRGRFEETCALKAIPIISERGEYKSLSDRRKEEYQRALSERAEYATGEVMLMSIVGNHTNIVDYKDHSTAEWEDENGFGCDLLIRMELLRDLRGELERGRIFSEEEVIQIGKDICSALVICHGKDILHRDIKPENIFFNDDGDYKLGDFGIARILDKCPGSYASTVACTPQYAAPEQIKGKYDMSVDIYSLGLVLYELTNQNRLPFAKSPYVKPSEVDERIHAKILRAPCDASPELAKVIIKACAHTSADRYQSAQEMLDALNQLGNTEPAEREPSVPRDSTRTTDPVPHERDYDTKPALPDFVHANSGQDSVAEQSTASEKVRELLQKANAGNASAQTSLGYCYYSGDGVDVDYKEAVKWFKKAAENGDACAMFNMGVCYDFGYGIEKNDSLAVEWYQKAADMGNPDAMYNLGCHYYYFGLGVAKTCSIAVEWFRKAADMSYVLAMYRLGCCYYYGHGVEKNYSLAIEWFQKAADIGNASAMYYLGRCYYCGHGVDKNDPLAVEWFQKAVDMGNTAATVAMHFLGHCHCHEDGVNERIDEDNSISVERLQEAADMGNPGAMYLLGRYYYDEPSIEHNYSIAAEWFQKAADMGNADAMYWLGRCYSNGTGVEKNHSLAIEWYQKAADEGSTAARYLLGYNYY